MPRLCRRARHMTQLSAGSDYGPKVSQRAVVEEAGRRDWIGRQGTAVRSAPKNAEFSSWREWFHAAELMLWWRTKLDFGSGESLDDLHRSTALRAAPRIGGVFGGGGVLVRLAAVVPSPSN